MSHVVTRVVDFRCEATLRRALAASVQDITLAKTRAVPGGLPDAAPATARVLVIADARRSTLDFGTARAVCCGRHVNDEVEVLLFTDSSRFPAVSARSLHGVARVHRMDAAADLPALALQAAEFIRARAATHVFAPACAFGQRLIAVLAGILGVSAITNVLRVLSPSTFARRWGFASVATVESRERPLLATVRLGALDAAALPRHRPAWSHSR